MTTQYIIGNLAATKPKAITKYTYRHIYKAITENNLYGIVFAENWQEGVLTFNNHTPDITPNECESPLEFIDRLSNLLKADEITKLELEGEITVTVPQENPVVFRLIIEDGKIYHQQAALEWGKKTDLF